MRVAAKDQNNNKQTFETRRGWDSEKIRKEKMECERERLPRSGEQKLNLFPAGTEGTKSIHNGCMIRAKNAAGRARDGGEEAAIAS